MKVDSYLAFATISARQRWLDRGVIVGRIGFYAVILFVFSRFWSVVLERKMIDGAGFEHFVAYIAVTEWIVLSLPTIHLDVEEDLRSGDLVYRLIRPTSYPATKLAEALGDMLVRMLTLGPAGFILVFVMTGHIPFGLGQILLLVPVGVLAGALSLVFQFGIGLASFWLHDCQPLYWVWQKAGFVLGGLLVPLELYPSWLRTIAIASPFAAILHGPGRIALGGDVGSACVVLAKLMVWLTIGIILVAWLYRRAVKQVVIGGG